MVVGYWQGLRALSVGWRRCSHSWLGSWGAVGLSSSSGRVGLTAPMKAPTNAGAATSCPARWDAGNTEVLALNRHPAHPPTRPADAAGDPGSSRCCPSHAQRLLAAHLLRAAESRSPPTAGRVASRNRGLTRHAGAVANARRPGRAPLLRCRTLARQGNANATDLPSSPARPRLRHGIARETLASDVAHVRSFEWLPHCQWGTHGSW